MEHQRKQSIEQHVRPHQPPRQNDPQAPTENVEALRTSIMTPADETGGPPLQPSAVLYLQRTIGNHAVQQLLSSSPAAASLRTMRRHIQRAMGGGGGDGLPPDKKLKLIEITEKTGKAPDSLPDSKDEEVKTGDAKTAGPFSAYNSPDKEKSGSIKSDKADWPAAGSTYGIPKMFGPDAYEKMSAGKGAPDDAFAKEKAFGQPASPAPFSSFSERKLPDAAPVTSVEKEKTEGIKDDPALPVDAAIPAAAATPTDPAAAAPSDSNLDAAPVPPRRLSPAERSAWAYGGAERTGVGSFHAQARGARWVKRGEKGEWVGEVRPADADAANAASIGADTGTFQAVTLLGKYAGPGEKEAPETRIGSSVLKHADWADGEKVKYITDPAERASYELKFNMANKKFYWRGSLMDTSDFDASTNDITGIGSGVVIFVMTTGGKIYVADEGTEAALGIGAETTDLQWRFNHSSFIAGEAIATAGEMKFKDGVLVGLTNASGHYQPGMDTLATLLRHLQTSGCDISQIRVSLEDWSDIGPITGQAVVDHWDISDAGIGASREERADLDTIKHPLPYDSQLKATAEIKAKIAATLEALASITAEGAALAPPTTPAVQRRAQGYWQSIKPFERQLYIDAAKSLGAVPAAKARLYKTFARQDPKVQVLYVAVLVGPSAVRASSPAAAPTTAAAATAPTSTASPTSSAAVTATATTATAAPTPAPTPTPATDSGASGSAASDSMSEELLTQIRGGESHSTSTVSTGSSTIPDTLWLM